MAIGGIAAVWLAASQGLGISHNADPIAESQPAATRPYLEAIRDHLRRTLPTGDWEEIEWHGTRSREFYQIPYGRGELLDVPAHTLARLRYRADDDEGNMQVVDQTFRFYHDDLPAISRVWTNQSEFIDGWYGNKDAKYNDPPPLP